MHTVLDMCILLTGYGNLQPFGEVGGATALPSAPPQTHLPTYQPPPFSPQWSQGGAQFNHAPAPPSHTPPRQAATQIPTEPTMPRGYDIMVVIKSWEPECAKTQT